MKAFLICCFFVLCAYPFYGVQGCTGWDTTFGNGFKMQCDSGKSFFNIQSAHSDQKDDRVWGYHCRDNSYITTSCKWSRPEGQYHNNYEDNVDFICPGEGYMVGMYAGTHHSYYKDRRFDFKCCDAKPGLGQSSCKWTPYVNTFEGDMNYIAPSGYFIAGAFSVHQDSNEDRRWKFYICK